MRSLVLYEPVARPFAFGSHRYDDLGVPVRLIAGGLSRHLAHVTGPQVLAAAIQEAVDTSKSPHERED